MASRKSLEDPHEPNISEAADRAGSRIRGLESRLRARSGGTDVATPAESPETPDHLDRQLRKYFEDDARTGQTATLEEIRHRVIEAVVDRILQEWDHPAKEASAMEHPGIESQVLKRLVDRVIERLGG